MLEVEGWTSSVCGDAGSRKLEAGCWSGEAEVVRWRSRAGGGRLVSGSWW